MMNPDDMLPLELCLRDDGHVDDIALAAVADGEERLVPQGPLAHLDACDACTHRLGEAAMLSARVGLAVVAMNRTLPSSSRAKFPVPFKMIAAALAMVLLSAVPALLDAPSRVAQLMSWLMRSLPLFLRTFTQLFRGAEGGLGVAGVCMSVVATLVLVSLGLAVAKTMPKPTMTEGAWS